MAASHLRLTSEADSVDDAGTPAAGSTWPHQLSHEPTLKVSEVLRTLSAEFPALSLSKVRFIDSQGLVRAQRTASGYRQYSASDVERLRFVLREQRDHYRPLGAIGETLAQLDAGELRRAITPSEAAKEEAAFVPLATLAALADAPVALAQTLVSEGLIEATTPGGYDRALAPLVTAVQAYLDAGGDVHAVRMLRHAAQRERENSLRATAPQRARGEDGAAAATHADRMHAAARLFTALAMTDTVDTHGTSA